MLNLPILPILIALPLVGLAFVLLSPEGDDFAKESSLDENKLWVKQSPRKVKIEKFEKINTKVEQKTSNMKILDVLKIE